MSGLFGGGSKGSTAQYKETTASGSDTAVSTTPSTTPATATPTAAPAYAVESAAAAPTPTAPPATDPAVVAMDTRRRLAAGKYRSTLITDEVGGRSGGYG